MTGVTLGVVLSNTLVSTRYRIELKTKTLSQLTTELTGTQARAADQASNPHSIGMVPGREGAVLFVTSGVAYTDASAPQQN